MDDVTRDTLAGGKVVLWQPRTGHRAGTDAVLLAGFADVRAGDHVADFGSASGAVGLMIARRQTDTRLLFVERDPDLAALCARNLDENSLSGRARIVAEDLFGTRADRAAAGLAGGDVDLLVTNPPFFTSGGRASPDPGRRAAHVLDGGSLGEWLNAAADALRPRGRLAMIHRADQLSACLDALRPRFGSAVIRPVHPTVDRSATRILIAAKAGGRAPLELAPPLILHGPDGFEPEAARYHAGTYF